MHISFRKNPSRILIICALCVVFLIGMILGHLNTDGGSEDRSFQTYTDRLFREEVSGKTADPAARPNAWHGFRTG